MYLAGVSTRRIEDVSELLWGAPVSSGTVSNLNERAFASIEAWRQRPLDGGYPYVFADGIYLKRSWGGSYENVAVLVAIGVNSVGDREIIGCSEGTPSPRSPRASSSSGPRDAFDRRGQTIGAVVDGAGQGRYYVFSVQTVLSAPFAVRFFCDVRCRQKLNLCVVRLPFPPIHLISNNPILNPRDTRWERLIISINGKALFLGIQVLLNAVGIFFGPFISLAISHKVIVGQIGRAVGLVGLLVVCRVVGVGDCHELVGQAKVQMALVQVSVPVVAGVVPG